MTATAPLAPRRAAVALLALALLAPALAAGTGPAAAAPLRAPGVADLPDVPEGRLAESVLPLTGDVLDLEAPVEDVATTEQVAGGTVVTLRSDVLFSFGRATMPPSAPARIAALVAGVPRGAAVKVYGHTDSVGSPAANLALSRARARAVAAAVRAARPDLRLDVRGFGETRPVAPNTSGGRDDPGGRAKNRRVELRY